MLLQGFRLRLQFHAGRHQEGWDPKAIDAPAQRNQTLRQEIGPASDQCSAAKGKEGEKET